MTGAETPFLALRDLALDRGGKAVLDGFSIEVRGGEVFGLLGPNGAGKSSAFLALAGLIPVKRGELTIDGRELPLGGAELRRRTGVVFQEPALDGRLTPLENLTLAAGLYGLSRSRARKRAEEMVAFARLEDRGREPVKKLSGGMRRRLELARARLHEPEFLLMDEPTTGLDERSYQEFWSTLRGLVGKGGVTVLLTTHRAEEADLCDRLAFLAGGRIVATGTPGELKASLGGDRVEVDVADPEAAAARIREELGLEATAHPGGVHVTADSGPEEVPRIARLFPGETLRSIRVHPPGLADVYLERTGRALVQGDA